MKETKISTPHEKKQEGIDDEPALGPSLKKTPVLLLFLFTTITAGIYVPCWFLTRRASLNALTSREKLGKGVFIFAIVALSLSLLLTLVGGALEGAGEGIQNRELFLMGKVVSLLARLSSVVAIIVLLIQGFKVKRTLSQHCKEHLALNVPFSGVATFFFLHLYLQYKINRLQEITSRVLRHQEPYTGRETKNARADTQPEEQQSEEPAETDGGETKTCPKCAETIKVAAVVCRHCGYQFDEAEVTRQVTEREQKSRDQKEQGRVQITLSEKHSRLQKARTSATMRRRTGLLLMWLGGVPILVFLAALLKPPYTIEQFAGTWILTLFLLAVFIFPGRFFLKTANSYHKEADHLQEEMRELAHIQRRSSLVFVEQTGTVQAALRLHLRESPSSRADVVGTIFAGTTLPYVGWVTNGEPIEGNPKWYEDSNGNYFWSGGISESKGDKS